MDETISVEKLVRFLSRVDGFQEIPHGDLESAVVPIIGVALYGPEQLIIKRGTRGTSLFILYEGHARVEVITKENRLVSFDVDPGSILGEMSLISNNLTMADVISVSQSTVLTLDIETFQSLMQSDWRFTKAFAGMVGRRLVNRLMGR